jgi:hypothetical protein
MVGWPFCSESYYRLLRVVKAGGGPQDAFRPYLFSTMRRFAIDTARSYRRRVTLTDQAADLRSIPRQQSSISVRAGSGLETVCGRADRRIACVPKAEKQLVQRCAGVRVAEPPQAPVLHVDKDFDLIASVTGQPVERLRL